MLALRTFFVILIALTISTSAAASISLVQDDRRSSDEGYAIDEDTYAKTSYDDHFAPSAPFADWVGNYQSSTVSTTLMTGSAQASAYTGNFYAFDRDVHFDVTFDVLAPTTIDIQGTATLDAWIANGLIDFALSEEVAGVLYQNSSVHGDIDLIFNAVLAPGRYRLHALADPDPGGGIEPTYDFTATFATVPEPSSALLVGTGLVAAGRWRNRSARRRRVDRA